MSNESLIRDLRYRENKYRADAESLREKARCLLADADKCTAAADAYSVAIELVESHKE